jgi:hypothetical protein
MIIYFVHLFSLSMNNFTFISDWKYMFRKPMYYSNIDVYLMEEKKQKPFFLI